MALRKVTRRRAPLDGTWFRTSARLQSIMRAAARYDDEMNWPSFVEDTMVPVWVRMEKYKAAETREHPDGMIHGPVVKVGLLDSPELALHGNHHAAGLYADYTLDSLDAGVTGERWIYTVLDGDYATSPGEEVSLYLCDKCGHGLFRDDFGRRHSHSACLKDGELVCRECDWHGIILTDEVYQRAEKCRNLADYVGADCRRSLERGFEDFARKESGNGTPLQTRVFLDGEWSFFWSTRGLRESEWKPYMHGGLIMHGPTPKPQDDGTYLFETYDYGLKAVRPATTAEIDYIHWSIHT